MDDSEQKREERLAARRASLHMRRTTFSEKVLPAAFILLGVATIVLIILALTVLLGLSPWQ